MSGMAQQNSPSLQTWQQVNSPDSFMPPAKRQRLSPGPMSPYTPSSQTPYAPSPLYNNITLPNAYPPQRSLNGTPVQFQAPRAVGVMGPPQRPVEKTVEKTVEKGAAEKHMDIHDLSDSVISSGIDLREEENLLAASYRTDRNILGQSLQNGAQANGFDILSQNAFSGIDAQRGLGLWGDTKLTAEEELNAKHKKAARAFSEGQQHHLDEPFLWGACLRRHLDKAASESGIRIPVEGLFDRIQDKPQSISGTSMRGADGAGVVAVQAPSILNRNTPLEGVLSLLSLATNERLRTLLEDAYGLARGRQTSSDGVVPPDWSDLATGDKPESTLAVPSSVSKTAWDQPQTLPSPPVSDGSPVLAPRPQPTTSFPSSASPLAHAVTSIARRERQAEEARLKRRAERRAKKAAAAVAGLSPLTPSSANGGTPLAPGMLGQVAPEVKMTKKERERLAKQDITEEVQTRLTNNTATMQLGGKAYAWMTGGKKTGGSGPGGGRLPGGGGGPGASSGSHGPGGAGAGAASADGVGGSKDRKFGEWREDGVGGRGVQLRDWFNALEADGRDRKTLNFAMAKLGRERTGDVSAPGSAS